MTATQRGLGPTPRSQTPEGAEGLENRIAPVAIVNTVVVACGGVNKVDEEIGMEECS